MNCRYRLINGSEPDDRPSNEQQARTRDFVILCRGGDVRQNDIKDTCSPAGRERRPDDSSSRRSEDDVVHQQLAERHKV